MTKAQATGPLTEAWREEYARRRQIVADAVGDDAALILPAASERIRNRDVHYPFRQDSDFSWLTGFPEPDALAVLAPGHKGGDLILFVRPRDPERELWDGRRAGTDGAVDHYGAAKAYPLDRADRQLPKLLANRSRVYCPFGADAAFDRRVMGWIGAVRAQARKGVTAPTELVAASRVLHELRLRKSELELAIMRRAAQISADGHRLLMQTCRPGLGEQQLERVFIDACARHGGRFQAYTPIVGGGANACILHYVENSATLRDGDLVLIDAGCELDGYASDITRTFPVNGRFSPAQRDLYALVLDAQRAAIDAVEPGRRWSAPHKAAVEVLTTGLVKLGILEGTLDDVPKLIKKEKYKPFYMHRTGHWLGMDVHDVGDYKQKGKWRRLEPGMVLTVEPGLYIAPDAKAPKKYRGIGIRIEDDVLVTEHGHEVLSADAPKQIDEIEALMAAAGAAEASTRKRAA